MQHYFCAPYIVLNTSAGGWWAVAVSFGRWAQWLGFLFFHILIYAIIYLFTFQPNRPLEDMDIEVKGDINMAMVEPNDANYASKPIVMRGVESSEQLEGMSREDLIRKASRRVKSATLLTMNDIIRYMK